MLEFSKYHGCGNSFVVTRYKYAKDHDLSALAQRICDESIGIGADGFILVKEDPLEMVFYNRDGSMAPMCGNGIRCFSNYCVTNHIVEEKTFPVLTGAGTMIVTVSDGEDFYVKVNMGKADLNPKSIDVDSPAPFLNQSVEGVNLSSFFMGTVHTVVWDNDPMAITNYGEKISNSPVFRSKTNVNFANITGDNYVKVSTYERGVGPTYACGTGSCAVAVLGWMEGKFKEGQVTVDLPYGKLYITQDQQEQVFMEGPSTFICSGTYNEDI